ncbi:MAG: hypothetical protein Q7U75_10305 [Desulfobacterales bacterium]|nr:hypothetical protein [Desulfobacterales bacterium]
MPDNRHGSSVSLQEVECTRRLRGSGGSDFQGEYSVRNNAQFYSVFEPHVPPEWLALTWTANGQVVAGNQLDAAVTPAGDFQCDHEVGGEKCMFQELSPDIPVLSAPIWWVAGAFQFRLQQICALPA